MARQRPSAAAQNAPGRQASAYTPKPQFASSDPPSGGTPAPPKRGWLPWAAGAAAAVVLLGGGLALHHHPFGARAPTDNVLILDAADIDQAATASARAMLARGEIPPSLANASPQTRQDVADGKEALYTKQLIPPKTPPGLAVDVTVTEAGSVLGENLLTSEHPVGTTFPAGPGMPVHFHFVVQSAGPQGTVTCWVHSETGATVYTLPMATGGSADLEAVSR
jgi:hypothetical protein